MSYKNFGRALYLVLDSNTHLENIYNYIYIYIYFHNCNHMGTSWQPLRDSGPPNDIILSPPIELVHNLIYSTLFSKNTHYTVVFMLQKVCAAVIIQITFLCIDYFVVLYIEYNFQFNHSGTHEKCIKLYGCDI